MILKPSIEGLAVKVCQVHETNSESCGLCASVRRRFDKVLGYSFLSRERTTFLRTPLDDRPDIYVRSVAINEPLHASFTSSLVVSFFGVLRCGPIFISCPRLCSRRRPRRSRPFQGDKLQAKKYWDRWGCQGYFCRTVPFLIHR